MGKRISSELYAIEQMQTHQLKDTPSTSATIRLTLWRTAAEAIAKRPLTGYGGAARKIVLKDAGLPVHLVGQIGHFHNSYLELWLSYGVLGPLVFIGILILLGWRLIAASRQKCLAPDFALFGLSWLAFFATVNIFESYVSYRSGAYLIFIVGGALYSIAIPARRTIRHHNDGSRPDSRPAPVNGGTSGRSGEQIRAAD
jgi:O-antigen ligase